MSFTSLLLWLRSPPLIACIIMWQTKVIIHLLVNDLINASVTCWCARSSKDNPFYNLFNIQYTQSKCNHYTYNHNGIFLSTTIKDQWQYGILYVDHSNPLHIIMCLKESSTLSTLPQFNGISGVVYKIHVATVKCVCWPNRKNTGPWTHRRASTNGKLAQSAHANMH